MEQKSRIVSPFSNEARNAYVIEHITESLLKLLKEKPMQEISISEIVDTAGVGRTSFYRNYETKEDVVKKYIVNLLEKWDQDYKASGKDSNAELYGSLFKHLKDNGSGVPVARRTGHLRLPPCAEGPHKQKEPACA